MTLSEWGALLLLLVLVAGAIDFFLGLRRLARLREAEPYRGPKAPFVSIVVAAKDEARGIEAAARSLLQQRYPAFKIVAVDDRSTDATGEILDRLAAQDSRLTVVHVRELPPGWLGKNHALAIGAAAARGEWLLFTDADVVLTPDALLRAVGYAEQHRVDHLAALPDIRMPGLFLQAFTTAFVCLGSTITRPWKVRDRRSFRFMGVGAFNLVRTAAYRQAGGHELIRLRPDDDVKLGKILKASGAQSEVVLAHELVSVEWYHSLGAAIDGLMKNSFSIVEYRTLFMLGGIPFYLIGGLAPLAGLLFGSGLVPAFGALAVAVQLAVMLRGARETGAPGTVAALYPALSLVFAWILVRALVLNLWQGGIVWRGTFYPLSELRKNRV